MGGDDLQLGAWTDAIKLGGKYNRRAISDVFYSSKRQILKYAFKRSIGKGGDFSTLINRQLNWKYSYKLGSLPQHAPAESIKHFAPTEWDNYFKFCFVRNPYNFAVSDYKWRLKATGIQSKDISFTSFLERILYDDVSDPDGIVAKRPQNWSIYTINNEFATDFIGSFENLYHDLKVVLSKIGVSFNPEKFPANKQSTSKRINYRDWYTNYEKKLVYEIHKEEIEAFGYEF